ncbi:MAG TPA: hypothetical protein VJL29_12170 [Thermoguttaceae bacterium]|nr:hypothetical protein [Thermoguttaceae bacterium]
MKVLIITEDHTLDQYIVKPIVRELFDELGRGHITVDVCCDPRIQGIHEATNSQVLAQVFDNYPQADLFLLIIDGDCLSSRDAILKRCLGHAKQSRQHMFGCIAREEVEIWALALHRDALPDTWKTVRKNCHPKDAYFEPFSRNRNWTTSVGKGRKQAMKNLHANWQGLKSLCSELKTLQQEIKDWLN